MELLAMQIGWGTPVGIGLFLLSLAGSFYLFSIAIKNLDSVDSKKKK